MFVKIREFGTVGDANFNEQSFEDAPFFTDKALVVGLSVLPPSKMSKAVTFKSKMSNTDFTIIFPVCCILWFAN